MGMFDPPVMVKYAQIPFSENDSDEHRKLSVRVAQESMVLLKNSNQTLPLKKDLKRIAVIGPTADSYDMLLGNYNGIPSKYVTPLQGIINKVGRNTKVLYEQGCNLVEEGGIVNDLSSDIVSNNGTPGLRADYFKNTTLEGEPFFTRFDPLEVKNWIWGARIDGIGRKDKFAIRWSGIFTAPETGEFNFIVQGDDGYRLYIDDKLVLEDWTEHDEISQRSNHVSLEKGKSYNFKLEYFRSSGRPHLTVKWEFLNRDYTKEAIDLAKISDVIIFVGGITAQLEGEEMPVEFDGFKGGDRTHLKLPKVQSDLVKVIHSLGKPVVLVLSSGSALAVNWANENISAIVQMWYPGQEGGTALADILFG
ncbi:MAG: glycoside hydrolase family 3 C-terminal domain-containing protein, partial [Candidatus Heimdallarchaeota archaeon]|nr:glycoside hydrolase family 3 C-terminal domain-containing protein [Candidatus Heimdallarchaeota archaeon]